LKVYYKLIRYTLVFNHRSGTNYNNATLTIGGTTYTNTNYQVSGVVLGQMGRPVEPFEIISEFFMKLAMLIMRTTPIAVFCAILSMILGAGLSSLLSVLGLFFTFLVGLLCMIIIYCLILLISGLSPLHFLRKYGGTMLQVFSIASSNASITVNVEACQKKLGISPRIYSLSIPLGATINMDGTSILLAVQALTLAKIYGINVSGNMLFSLALSIIVMSIGAPGVPGSGLIILSMLLTQLGVPVEGVALVMGIGPLVGMFISMCNCLGDVVITTAVAKSEKQIDMEVYRKET
ncbi:MAG: cation:dicarboxylase symporter family transporter, partial [Blautia sp.]|nr:cation:dicarboxylase symporter family transporter [Blautia sp.]